MKSELKIGDKVKILSNHEFIEKYQKLCPVGSIVEIKTVSDGSISVYIGDKQYSQHISRCYVEPIKEQIPIPKQTNKKSKKQVIENTIRHIIIGNKTIVLSKDSEGKTIKGEAIRHRTEDVFDANKGLLIAMKRMLGIDPFPKSETMNNPVKNTISDGVFDYIVSEEIVVICETEEEASDYLKYLHSKGYIWNDFTSRSLLDEDNGFNNYIGDVCYYLEEGKEISYSGMAYAKGGSYVTKKYKELVNKPSIFNKPSISVKTLSAYTTEELLEEIKSRTK